MANSENEKILQLLSNFGISQQEAEIYLAALTLKKTNPAEIANKIKKSRTATYFHIKNLINRGLLQETRNKTKLQVIALPPSKLASIFDRFSIDFKSMVPQLESLQKIDSEAPTIRITDSKRGYLEVLDEISVLPAGSKFRVIEGRDALNKEISLLTHQEWQTFFSRIIERKVETKAIFTLESTTAAKKFKPSNLDLVRQRIWHLVTIPESTLPANDLIMIYGDKVCFVFFETSLVMTINHKGIAQAMQAMFDGLFIFGKPFSW